VGVNPESNLVEVMEQKKHPWFVGVQYHPELKSTVDSPHPLFIKFVQAAMEERKRRESNGVEVREEKSAVYVE
jgi:CTP synthase